MEKNIALSQRESYTPSSFTHFLWWLATAEKEMITDALIDRNRYRIIGMTVLGTWLFATTTWTYFFSTMVTDPFIYISLGLFMGFIILSIDRALIKGITKNNKRKLTPLLLRGLLALTIGNFMAQPAVLYMFDKEIKVQTSFDNENKKIAKRTELDSLFKNQKVELIDNKNKLLGQDETRYQEMLTAKDHFLAETDGSGGSGKVGISTIAKAKLKEYQKLDSAYRVMASINKIKTDSIDVALATVAIKIKKEEAGFESLMNDGFLTRIEALTHLLDKNKALQYRYYLIVFILMLIELMPVIAKTILPTGTYDEKVKLREAMEIEMASYNIQREQLLKEAYNQMAFENDKEAISAFFSFTKADRNEKIKAFSQRWRDEHHQSFDGLWEKMKKDIISKQEN
ncbi:MAG: DUF4407 domain-containing protein [Niastella sp.]|nr:DUF4407 domain-containing protein [Niastella sp.]